ncbi:OmpH family outer membrane protein [Rubrivirga sp.]|uniref:OmpH family outer membrane protein n=1 Tax=Rubrivirga sp. TaxID=1885344 RepID=UPI003C75A595
MTSRFLPLLAFALMGSAAIAQPVKVGFVDTDQIVIRMQAFADVQQQLQQQQQAVGTRVRVIQDSLQQVLRTRVEEYQTFDQSPIATDEARFQRQQEIVQLQGQVEQAEVQGLQYLSYTEARLLQPVLNQIDEAIRAEAESGGYDLILPTVANNAPVFLYRSERVEDLTVPIMTRLGVDPNMAPIGTPSAQAAPVEAPSIGN